MSDDPDCLGMCAMDGDVCTGCGRTLDQINAARGGEGDEVRNERTGGPDARLGMDAGLDPMP